MDPFSSIDHCYSLVVAPLLLSPAWLSTQVAAFGSRTPNPSRTRPICTITEQPSELLAGCQDRWMGGPHQPVFLVGSTESLQEPLGKPMSGRPARC